MGNIHYSRIYTLQDFLSKKLCNPKLTYIILGTVSFLESIFFPISPIMILIPLCLIKKQRWLSYSLVVSFFSVAGSLVMFTIGYFCWESLVYPLFRELDLTDNVDRLSQMSSSGLYILVPAIGAFTPVTYNVVSALCGFIAANSNDSFMFMLVVFSLSAGICRTIRFIAETWLIVKIIEGNKYLIKNFPAIASYVRKKFPTPRDRVK